MPGQPRGLSRSLPNAPPRLNARARNDPAPPGTGPSRPEPALPAARPVIEGVLLAKVAEVLLLLLGHRAEQLAAAAVPAFTHSGNKRQARRQQHTGAPTGKLSHVGAVNGGGECRKEELFYVRPSTTGVKTSGARSCPLLELLQGTGRVCACEL